MTKTLIAYYSFSNGNTRKNAEKLQKILNADIQRIETVKKYPPYAGSTSEVVSLGKKEVDEGYCPEIKELEYDVDDYDVIVIATPTWWYTMAPAVLTFIRSYDWTDKTVVALMTHGGWPGHVIKDIQNECEGASFMEGFEIQYDSNGGDILITEESDIIQWMNNLKESIQ